MREMILGITYDTDSAELLAQTPLMLVNDGTILAVDTLLKASGGQVFIHTRCCLAESYLSGTTEEDTGWCESIRPVVTDDDRRYANSMWGFVGGIDRSSLTRMSVAA